jgi:hypothetical protein
MLKCRVVSVTQGKQRNTNVSVLRPSHLEGVNNSPGVNKGAEDIMDYRFACSPVLCFLIAQTCPCF